MTTHDLRKIVLIETFHNDLTGAEFVYRLNHEAKLLAYNFDSLFSELNAIGSIESKWELLEGYKLSQWDALNLVIRHEYTKYVETIIMDSDLGKSIDNLTKQIP